MQDIVDKFDRAKELLELAGPAGASLTDEQQDAAAKELLGLGIDAIGELVASARRIAVALETIAENTKPGELIQGEAITAPSLFPDHATLEDMAYRAGQAFTRGQQAG